MLRTAAATGGQGVRAGSTGASGAFAFENLSAENYLISAQRNGFVGQDGVRRPGGSPPGPGHNRRGRPRHVRDCHQAGSAFRYDRQGDRRGQRADAERHGPKGRRGSS